ncbi:MULTISPECIES: hypothetical protein [unclassified Olleya]|uniref:hypothetical protein n=1 Tax=unclassified Olleya TaxID=2615019 RepID=UPI000C30CB1C|nr:MULTISPECIES: hypothetical protein [unclassified Olleya]AUC74795.1 hypothetical protein CW732_03515 [Olleya sp. Bg11-27]QXP60718.1 hypothetical protein H0I26_03510 [Olleya sp. HaHaR_3_96]
MKKLITALIVLLFMSCSVDEEQRPRLNLEPIPIESVTVPEYFEQGQTYQIDLNYIQPTNCYAFYDIYYVKEDNIRTIAIINSVYDSDTCEDSNLEVEKSFNFIVTDQEDYIFKFWQGEDANGENVYLTMEIPVQ